MALLIIIHYIFSKEIAALSAYNNAVLIMELVFYSSLIIIPTYYCYKPVKLLFKPRSIFSKFLCVLTALAIFSFEVTGIYYTIEAIKDKSAHIPKYYPVLIAIPLIVVLSAIKDRNRLYKLAQLDAMDGHDFEYACAKILEANGYKNVQVTKASGDYGVDITAYKDKMKVAVQCKRYSSKLDNSPIQEVIAGLSYYNCTKGIVMTNNYFTEPARVLARVNNVELIDRDALEKMISKSSKNKNRSNENRTFRKRPENLQKAEINNIITPPSNANSLNEYAALATNITNLESYGDILQNYLESVSLSITSYLIMNGASIYLENIDARFKTNEAILELSIKDNTRVSQIKKLLKGAAENAGIEYADYVYPTSTPHTIGIKIPLPEQQIIDPYNVS